MEATIEIFNNLKSKACDNTSKILLKVKSGARKNSIDGFIEIEGRKYLKISIKAEPTKGKANKMIIEFMAKELNISKADLEISAGKTSQYKLLNINK